MKGQTIGKMMPHGYAGSYARQPDMIVDTHPLSGNREVVFGQAVFMGNGGGAIAAEAGVTAAKFLGVAVREIKSALSYVNQNEGKYQPGEAIPVMKRGCINVICQAGTPAPGGKVYIRVTANAAKPNLMIGGFEAAEDKDDSATYTMELSNAQWKGTADSNGVAEMRILTILNA
jgi:hypothetical protein